MVMSCFDKWFAKKSKFVWDECKKEGNGLPPSKTEFDYLKSRVQDLEMELHRIRFDSQTGTVNRRMDMLEAFLNIEVDDKPKYRKKEETGEYSFIVQDWGIEGPRFKSEQNDWPPVGTKFVSVKE